MVRKLLTYFKEWSSSIDDSVCLSVCLSQRNQSIWCYVHIYINPTPPYFLHMFKLPFTPTLPSPLRIKVRLFVHLPITAAQTLREAVVVTRNIIFFSPTNDISTFLINIFCNNWYKKFFKICLNHFSLRVFWSGLEIMTNGPITHALLRPSKKNGSFFQYI